MVTDRLAWNFALSSNGILKRWWGGYHVPRHWTLFQASSLRRLFEECGLTVKHCSYQTGHAAWMNSFHHAAKYNSHYPSSRLADWFELPKGLPMLIGFTGFDIVRRTSGARTSAILMVGQKLMTPAVGRDARMLQEYLIQQTLSPRG